VPIKVAGGYIRVSRYDGATRDARVGVNLGKHDGVAEDDRLASGGWASIVGIKTREAIA